jgi:putative glycosyltransferase (TIGR04372 family)
LGDCSREIYYALLKARRERKRVLLLFTRRIFTTGKLGEVFRQCNRELFALSSPPRVRNALLQWSGDWLLTLLYGAMAVPYLLWRRVLKLAGTVGVGGGPKPFNLFLVRPSWGRSGLWRPTAATGFSLLAAEALDWAGQYAEPLAVCLDAAKVRRAEKQRLEMGIPLSDWFACVHIRESGFYGDHVLGPSRNADIHNCIEGMKVITAAGGWVVRLGDPSMTPLPPLVRVVDYPHTRFKSEFMDLYLVSRCRFVVCTNSGPSELARLFQVPVVFVNLTDMAAEFPTRRGELAVIKHVYSQSRRRFLSLRELLDEPFECQAHGYPGPDYVMVENTPEEIKTVITEFLDHEQRGHYTPLQEAFREGRRRQIRRWLERGACLVSHPAWQVTEQYWLASRLALEGTLGRDFLERNWDEDELNRRTGTGMLCPHAAGETADSLASSAAAAAAVRPGGLRSGVTGA